MSEKHWATFFELLDKIVDLPGLSANEKAEKVRAMAAAHGSQASLSEFICWDLEDPTE